MDTSRKLVYEDRMSLNAFDIKKPGTINKLIFEKWMLARKEIDPFDAKHQAKYLKSFNDAYYICSLALMLPKGKNLLPDRQENIVSIPSVVFPLVHLYLSKLSYINNGIQNYLTQLSTAFENRPEWKRNHEELIEAVKEYQEAIDPKEFTQRELTKEILSSINWEKLTKRFKKKDIECVVRSFARKREDWHLMCEAIKAAAQQYDYDYGFEDYEQAVCDEDGCYMQTIKVPKPLYDSFGEEYLEPLKREGVYQFCDDLMEKYDELSLEFYAEQDATSPEPTTSHESLPVTGDAGINYNIFRHPNEYVKEKVKEALIVAVGENALTDISKMRKVDLALLQLALFDSDYVSNEEGHKVFLKQLIAWKLLPEITETEIDEIANRMSKKRKYIRKKLDTSIPRHLSQWSEKQKEKCRKEYFKLSDIKAVIDKK